MADKLTLEDVSAQFMEKHKGLYDYSKFVWVNAHFKSVIICREHGEFFQSQNNHRKGAGCPKCASVACSLKHRASLEDVLTAFHLKHQDLYDYSKFIYKNNRTKGIIICKTHGEFLMSANHHARGQGCPKCSGYGPVTQEEIIERFIEKYNGRYTYPIEIY
jgi:Zn finger protein HypA/HybF involved in hydrogenase expression